MTGFTLGGSNGATLGGSSGGLLGETLPGVPINVAVLSKTDSSIEISWDYADDNDDHIKVWRATSSGSTKSDYTHVATVDYPDSTYTDTGLNEGTTYYYRLSAVDVDQESGLSSEVNSTTDLNAPTNTSATVVANDQVDLTWTDNSSNEDNYRIQINRNGQGWYDIVSASVSATPAANTTSVSIDPGSHGGGARNTYEEVGADAEMTFRVRAETTDTTSTWDTSTAVYSEPAPPYASSASRSDGTNITLSWTIDSNIDNGTEVQYKEDTGTGYGAWTTATTTASGATSASFSVSGDTWMNADARYQFRVRTVSPDSDTSLWIYPEYGNDGNVYFQDAFESADTSAWDSTNTGTDGATQVTGTLNADFADTAPPEGAYAWETGAGGYLTKNLGDLSAESDVQVRVKWQSASNDSAAEDHSVEWYDGTAWQTLWNESWAWDATGWHEVTLSVPSTYLSTDNRLRLNGISGGGQDWVAFDHVVVSDILDEYTTPTAPSSLTSSTPNEDQIDISWTNNGTFVDRFETFYKLSTDASYTQDASGLAPSTTAYTFTGLLDGETYDTKTRDVIDQYRRGSNTGWWYNDNVHPQATTILPAPSSVTLGYVDNTQLLLEWVDQSDNTDNFRVEISRDAAAYVAPAGGATTPAATSTSETYGPNSDESYDSVVGIDSNYVFRIRAETEDANSSWTESPTQYTEPIPPESPSIARPDGSNLDINWTNSSDIVSAVEVQHREDDGSGYGVWESIHTTSDGTTTSYHTQESYSTFNTNYRYQYRLRSVASDGKTSNWVYSDYGNQGNVYFTDGFESGDLTNWTTTNLTDNSSGVGSGTVEANTAAGGPFEGSYLLELQDSDWVEKDLGDLSSESDVVVKCVIAAGSMEDGVDEVGFEWSDDGGTSWSVIRKHGAEYNKQGWVEVTAEIPDSLLGTNCIVRFVGAGDSGDYFQLDRVIVSDVVHNYVNPAKATNPTTSTQDDQITLEWDPNINFADEIEAYYREHQATSFTLDSSLSGGATSHTFTGLEDGELYEMYARGRIFQYVQGAQVGTWETQHNTVDQIAFLPAVTGISFDIRAVRRLGITWNPQDDSPDGDIQVWLSTDGSLGTQLVSGLGVDSTEYIETNAIDPSTTYHITVRRETDHTLSDTQESIESSGAVDDPHTDMRWYHPNDWDNLAEESGIIHQDVTGSSYTADTVRQGIDPLKLDNVIAYYHFDDTGPTLKDYSGEGNDATAMAWDSTNNELTTSHTVEYEYAGLNSTQAWHLDEANQDVISVPNLGIYGDHPFSVLMNVYCYDTSDNGGLFKFGKVDSGECFSLQTYGDNSAIVYGVAGVEETDVQLTSSQDMTERWAQVGAVYDPAASEKRLYLDGEQIHSKGISAIDLVNARYFLGGYPWGETDSIGGHTHFTETTISEALIANRAYSDERMKSFYDPFTTSSLRTNKRNIK